MVDNFTASAAELLSAALQDAGVATVIGEPTYGKGVIQTTVELMSGGAFRYTYAEYLRRSGEKIDGIGVIPDVAVMYPGELPPTIAWYDGNESDDIYILKNILSYVGLNVPDGSAVYDDETQGRVKDIQVLKGLPATGVLDEETIAAINDYLHAIYMERDVALETGYDILCAMVSR